MTVVFSLRDLDAISAHYLRAESGMPCAILRKENIILETTSAELGRCESLLAHAGFVVKVKKKMIRGTLII